MQTRRLSRFLQLTGNEAIVFLPSEIEGREFSLELKKLEWLKGFFDRHRKCWVFERRQFMNVNALLCRLFAISTEEVGEAVFGYGTRHCRDYEPSMEARKAEVEHEEMKQRREIECAQGWAFISIQEMSPFGNYKRRRTLKRFRNE